MSSDFRVTAKALIFDGDEILLIRKPEGDWDLPGGRLDAGEHPEQALRREIREEIGLHVEIGDLADCNSRRGKGATEVFVVSYHCRTKVSLKNIRLSDEHTEARFFSISKVHHLDMHDAYKLAARRGYAKLRHKADQELHPTAMEAFLFLFRSRVFNPS